MTPSERGRVIWRIGDLTLEHVDELAQLESLDNGKPFAVAQAGPQRSANLLFHYELARRLEGTGVTANVLHPA
jgi:phenylacetaldehyde dehydrogenase